MLGIQPKFFFISVVGFAFLALFPYSAKTNELGLSDEGDAAWRSVSLPFRPVCIAGDENVIWVGGVNEMLAKSEDGGQTWKVAHQKADGEVLLTIGLLDKGTIYASGTNGIMLWSSDSGETWKSWTAGIERIMNLSFSDDKHGIRHTLSGVQFTKDGGVQWSDVSIMKREDLLDYSNVFGVAALGSDRFVILVNKTQGENLFLASQDAGATWNALHLDDTYARNLFVRSGEVWAFGICNGRTARNRLGNLVVVPHKDVFFMTGPSFISIRQNRGTLLFRQIRR